MKILVALNALKGFVSAIEVAERISLGLEKSGLNALVDLLLMADDGDGIMDVLVAAGDEVCGVEGLDPWGSPIRA